MVLDTRLNWNRHIDYIVKKCNIPIRILNCIRGTWWGADPQTMLTLYKTLIRSRLEYGGFLISPCKPKQFYKLEKIQLRCLRLALGYRNSTPTNIITHESKILSLTFRFDYLSYKFLLRSVAGNKFQIINLLEDIDNLSDQLIYEGNFDKSRLVINYKEIFPVENIIYKSQIPVFYQLEFKNLFNSNIIDLNSGVAIKEGSNANKTFQDMFSDKLVNNTCIVTDGSKFSLNSNSITDMANWSNNQLFRRV